MWLRLLQNPRPRNRLYPGEFKYRWTSFYTHSPDQSVYTAVGTLRWDQRCELSPPLAMLEILLTMLHIQILCFKFFPPYSFVYAFLNLVQVLPGSLDSHECIYVHLRMKVGTRDYLHAYEIRLTPIPSSPECDSRNTLFVLTSERIKKFGALNKVLFTNFYDKIRRILF